MDQQILTGIRIVDLSTGIAGSVAAMLLAEAGAEVIKVEPPEGDPDRGKAGFAVWNRSKRSVTLDLEEQRDDLNTLLASADVLIHSFTPAEAAALQLDEAALKDRFPGLIVSAIAAYPAGHTEQDMPVRDTLMLARSGLMDEQRGCTRDGPIFLRFPLGSWGASYLAATGIVARLVHRGRGGAAGPAGTSLLQGALIPMAMHWYRADTPTESLARGMPKTSKPSLFECSDGVWLHLMKSPDEAPLMKQALEAMGGDAIARANEAAGHKHPMFPNWGANREILKTRPHDEWLQDLWASDVSVQPALPMGEIYFDEQAQANDYVLDVEDPAWGHTRQPGHPFNTTPPSKVHGPAARLGADTDSVLAALSEKPQAPAQSDGSRKAAAPLEGVKVLDFGNFLAGPLAAMMLSDLGADVIKIESTTGDQMRWVEGAFSGCQRGKRSLALQLKDPRARPVVERLVASADIVHHNLRMPAAMRLGLGYEDLRAINPDLIYCHVSSYGPKGPRKDWPGYDQLFQASCGWEYEGAGKGNPPMWHRFGMMDHQCAMASLLATLLGLYHRDRTGTGQFVSASLLGASLLTVSETIVGPDGKLTPFDRLDHEQTGLSAAHRIYKCSDGWVAVAAIRDGEVRRLHDAFGSADVAAIEAACAAQTVEDLLRRLADADVPAGPVLRDQMNAFFESAANDATGLIARYDHIAYGNFEQPGAFWNFGDDLDVALHRAPPGLGQHSREILAEAGFSNAEIDGLVADGVAVG